PSCERKTLDFPHYLPPGRPIESQASGTGQPCRRTGVGARQDPAILRNTFFQRRYGHRAVILETIAAVPGMVGGALTHLRSLRRFEEDHGLIKTLLEAAERAGTPDDVSACREAKLARADAGRHRARRVLQRL